MMQGQAPSVIDGLQGRLPPVLKYCLAGAGGIAGWHYAQLSRSPIPVSYIVAGAALGFGALFLVFAGLRLVKVGGLLALAAVVVNYAVLIPFGYGNHMPAWLAAMKMAGLAVLDGLARLLSAWGRGWREKA